MRKTDKKLDNQIRKVLTEVCEDALETIDGFVWLTHEVDYSNVKSSLKIICVFKELDQLNRFNESTTQFSLTQKLETKLKSINVLFKNIEKQIIYDNEEHCKMQHGGNWAKRIQDKYK